MSGLFVSYAATRLHRLLFLLGAVAAIALGTLSVQASAQSGLDFSGSVTDLGTTEAEVSSVVVSMVHSASEVEPGSELVLAVIMDHAEHFHTYTQSPKEIDGFTPTPTTVDLPEIAGVRFGAVHWPEPVLIEADVLFNGHLVPYEFFSKRSVIFVPVKIEADAPIGELRLSLTLGYQACDDMICEPPMREVLETTIMVVEQAASAQLPDVFAGYTPEASTNQSEEPIAAERKFLGLIVIPETGSLIGLLALALSAAIGGFVLNLTPCVLPVIPIKVMTISSHAGEDKSKTFMLSMWMAIGVIAFWVGIGIPVAFVSKFTDPSIIFGIWWITGLIGVVIVLMSVGIMGLFQIKLPQQVYMVNPKADSPWGSFVFGMMTAVLGLPCFGFVAGALLAGAATMPAYLVLVVFAFIGIGMAAPYVVLAMFPKLIDALPRTGPASELVKQVMGMLMLAAGAYFLGTAYISYGTGQSWVFPWWGKAAHWWVIGLVGLSTGVWLIIQTIRITKRLRPRLAFSMLGLMIASTGSYVGYNQTMHQYHYFWQTFTPEFLASSLDEGKVVVLDFTAEWCLNCKVLEAKVLSRDPVKPLLLSNDVVPMVADLTSTSAPGWKHLNETLGQTGIPFLVVYAPGLDEPVWMSNAYTSAQVIEAINQARAVGN